jgi:16S rRNA (cytosine967-C5)-methyltransferase
MTPGARMAAAITVLDTWLAGAPAEKALTSWARGARYAGSGDRAAIRDHVYDALRRLESCSAAGGGRTGRALMIGLVRQQGKALEELFTGGYAPEPLDGAEKQPPDTAFDAWIDVPVWLQPALREALGVQAEAVIGQMTQRAPLYLRVNARKAGVIEVEERLVIDGIITEKTILKTALKVTGGDRKLRQSQVYLEGLVEIQDLSVQQAVAAISWPRSGTILDYCAGGGGKALAIAATSDAVIHVHDANPARMRDLPPRAERAGVVLHPMDSARTYDVVLADVPCSGSGTWRRDPEAKWTLTPDRLAALMALQAEILEAARALVCPGGRLVYMTCSLLCAENEDQVAAFLDNNTDWQLTQQTRFLPPDASDGFFLAELTHDG